MRRGEKDVYLFFSSNNNIVHAEDPRFRRTDLKKKRSLKINKRTNI